MDTKETSGGAAVANQEPAINGAPVVPPMDENVDRDRMSDDGAPQPDQMEGGFYAPKYIQEEMNHSRDTMYVAHLRDNPTLKSDQERELAWQVVKRFKSAIRGEVKFIADQMGGERSMPIVGAALSYLANNSVIFNLFAAESAKLRDAITAEGAEPNRRNSDVPWDVDDSQTPVELIENYRRMAKISFAENTELSAHERVLAIDLGKHLIEHCRGDLQTLAKSVGGVERAMAVMESALSYVYGTCLSWNGYMGKRNGTAEAARRLNAEDSGEHVSADQLQAMAREKMANDPETAGNVAVMDELAKASAGEITDVFNRLIAENPRFGDVEKAAATFVFEGLRESATMLAATLGVQLPGKLDSSKFGEVQLAAIEMLHKVVEINGRNLRQAFADKWQKDFAVRPAEVPKPVVN